MNITIVKEDKVVMIDGKGFNFDFTLDDNVWAIQWDGTTGEVEYNDGTPNLTLESFSDYQYLVDDYNTEKKRLADKKDQQYIDDEAGITWSDRRREEYEQLNQWEMHFDDQQNGTTTWVDAINEIKTKYPKE